MSTSLIRGSGVAVVDGFERLWSEHRDVERQFSRYADRPDDAIAREICEKLTLHATIEERVLYPELRRVGDGGDDLADDAAAEHLMAKMIISRIYDSSPADLESLVRRLERIVAAHVQFEEDSIFPAMNEAGIDVNELAHRLDAAASEASARYS